MCRGVVLKKNIYGFVVRVGRRLLKIPFAARILNMVRSRREEIREEIDEDIKFSIIVPVHDPALDRLDALIKTVQKQTYANWELCFSGWGPCQNALEEALKEYSQDDSRIKHRLFENSQPESANLNHAIDMTSGDYVALCKQDDLLRTDALYENALAILKANPDVLYSDYEKITKTGSGNLSLHFVPDWTKDLLYSQMYISHFLTIKRSLLRQAGDFDSAFEPNHVYDIMLRLSEFTEKIYHIPKVLISWRETENHKELLQETGLNALNAHFKRVNGGKAHAYPTSLSQVWDARFETLNGNPKVSIIIPIKDKLDLTRNCVNSILGKSTYENYEIIIVNNGSTEDSTVEWLEQARVTMDNIIVVDALYDFNWSKLNNHGMRYATGDVFVFMNNDTEVITPDWIERLCENALRDDIGAVGPLLLYDDGTIQHAGVVVGMSGLADHVYKKEKPIHKTSPFVSPLVNRNVLAVTGACLCISRKALDKIGSFNENFIICGSDVELCIRAHEAGYRNMYNANVKLYHFESKSRDSYIPEIDFEMSHKAYAPYLRSFDPYYNPNFDLKSVFPRLVNRSQHEFKAT